MAGFHRLPLSNFRYCLTLFSKFFSPFPHGTCVLSVSGRYLALDEVYHLLWTGIPTYPTLRTYAQTQRTPSHRRDSHPPWSLFPKGYARVHVVDHTFSRLQLESPFGINRFNLELFPLHSPLLGESLLVSFPPLNNMLKFSGSSRLIRVLGMCFTCTQSTRSVFQLCNPATL